MTREEANNKDIWTANELLSLPPITDLNGKTIELNQIVELKREPYKGKLALVTLPKRELGEKGGKKAHEDRPTHVYELLDTKERVPDNTMWEGNFDWVQKVIIHQ